MELLFYLFLILVGIFASKSSNKNNKNSNNGFNNYKKYRPREFRNYWNEDFEGDGINPDSEWGKIRLQVFKRDAYKCLKCGYNQNLTVNHKVPLKFGGTNELQNLETLCKRCHEAIHNRRIFDPNYSFLDIDHYGTNVHLTKKISLVASAIRDHGTITIDYIDRKGNKTHRVISPNIIFEEGKRIYLKSYCHLRKEDRTFRISRLSIIA